MPQHDMVNKGSLGRKDMVDVRAWMQASSEIKFKGLDPQNTPQPEDVPTDRNMRMRKQLTS